ncbi:hypothetical protein [Deinococcus multiflagellatus]|uniref:Site-specific DNA-methyltransferase (adenine-specific) n=1 Tax=Deinococcus multiflagellatus TaxID=1656887 RepID=A0ABW1ZSI0_9DEIO
MKVSLPQRDWLTALCPMFITNVGQPAWAAPVSKGQPDKRADVILNGQLLPVGHIYGFTTGAVASPAPLTTALGVEALPSPTEAARHAANAAAREMLHSSEPDLSVLARYSGGGGIGESADEFYTPALVADAMWTLAGPLPTGATVFDPACGTGQLLARAPAGLHLVGCDLSTEGTAIARHLLPHADLRTMPFELYHRTCADPLYDAVVVNPPYGPRTMRHLDARSIQLNETYFLLKALERVHHHTGVVVALVNANLLYGESHRAWREELEQAALVTHTALVPTGAFKASGAGVTTAIVALRRHDLGVKEALAMLNPSERRQILKEFGQSCDWVKGKHLVVRQVQSDTVTYCLASQHSETRRLGRSRDLTTGRYGQATYNGPVDLSTDRLKGLRDIAAADRKAAGVPLGQVLESIRVHLGDDAAHLASQASRQASATPIPLGTRNPEGTWVYTVGGWAPTDDFSAPSVADALFLATAIGRALELAGDPDVDPTALTHARLLVQRLDAQYRARHTSYDAPRLGRLAGRFSRLSLLLANLHAGEVVLPGGDVRAPLTIPGDLSQVARSLSDQLLLTADSLAEHAAVSRAEALAHLSAQYTFNGEVWLDPGVYYVGNAVTMSEHARQLATQFSGPERTALLKQAEEFLRRMSPAALSDVQLSPRDRVIPAAVLEHWVNAFLNSYHTPPRGSVSMP